MSNTNIQNIIKYAIFTGLWAVLIIPFIVANGMFFPYIVGKNFTFRIIVEIIFALWVYLACVDVKFRPKFSWVLGAVALFVAVMGVADILAVAPAKSFWSNFERMDGWITLIHLLMYLVVFGNVMKGEKIWLWFFRSSLLMSTIMFMLSISEWLKTGSDRVSVTLGNPIYVAVYFLFNFFFALVLFYKDVLVKHHEKHNPIADICKNWLTYVYALLALISAYGIWRTGTRGVLLGLIGGIIVTLLIIAIFEKKNKFFRKMAIIKLIVIVAIIGGFFAIKNTQFVKDSTMLNRLSAISWNNVSGQGQARQYVWPMAIKGFQEKPILGWGQDGFNYVFNKYYDARMYNQEQWFDRAHNMPLDMLVAGGILGLLTYLSIFLATLWVIWKRREKLGIVDAGLLVGLLAGYFFQNLFVFDNLVSYFFFFIILAYVYSRDIDDKELSKELKVEIKSDTVNYMVLPVLIVIFGISLWYLNIRPINTNLNLINSIQGYKEGPSKNLEYFKKILSYNTVGTPEIREQLISIVPRVVGMEGVDNKIKQEFVDFTYSEVQKQVAETPEDARYQLFAGSLLDNLGQYEIALPYLQKAVELSPTKLTMLFELSKCLSYVGQKEQALEVAKKAYDLVPVFEEGKINYIATAIMSGNNNLVKELLGNATSTSQSIVRAYLFNASSFLKKGDKYSAVLEVNKAIKTVPVFKEQGGEVIKGIWEGTIAE
ncbi:MAG: O-antigen ligase family protein [Candidatus Taylorbacteria bacterium]|nr:O-antigen ligase family protein [Candidatus Taylorbacteria bacterium]